MFKFLKKKLNDAVGKFSKKAEEIDKEDTEEPKEKKKSEDIGKVHGEGLEEGTNEEDKSDDKNITEKKSVIGKLKEKITTTKISEKQFQEMFWDLEVALMESNIAVDVIDKIKESLRVDLVNVPLKRGDIKRKIDNSLRDSVNEVLSFETVNLVENIRDKKGKPYIIVFFGTNGSGKTTSIAKLANLLQQRKLKVVLAAGDTFRAAAIEQLQEWGRRLDTKVISHKYKSDPAAVAYDAIEYSKAHGFDVVLIDTAGRQHSNLNLVDEMKKIVRIANPDLKIFVGESTTGNDVVQQSKSFDDAIGIDGVILTKADIDEKGGAMVSVSAVTGKPILYLGVGQLVEDLKEFDKNEILKTIGLWD